VVWLPPELQLHGRFFDVSPQVRVTFSHGMPTISAATRWQSEKDSVPRLPMPVWTYILPSGLITNSPSKPMDPPLYELIETPTPRPSSRCAARHAHTLVPVELRSALLQRFLDETAGHVPALASSIAGPNFALPSGAFSMRIAT
jgi:hypothetical protein